MRTPMVSAGDNRHRLIIICFFISKVLHIQTALGLGPHLVSWTGGRTSKHGQHACDPSSLHDHREEESSSSSRACDSTARRDFMTLGSSLTAALSLLSSSPGEASAARTTGASSSTLGTLYDPKVPFSSIRRYKTITLSKNGLRVLLVSDKRASRAQCALTVQAGQFNDPDDLPGLAHLMEHMILSYNSKSTFGENRDFEEWLSDREGASNAFTANQKTCFHFSVPKAGLPQALERFAGLFLQENVETACRTSRILQREIRRVDSELNFDNVYAQEEYLTKAFVNLEHPYARFSKGSLESLEEIPTKYGIDVGECLIRFFRQHYSPKHAILVIVSQQDMYALERWAAPFAFAFSKDRARQTSKTYFPGQFLQGNRYKNVILYRKANESASENPEKLCVEWVMDLDYSDMMNGGKQGITGPQVAFVLNQIIGRRGPGSLYSFLLRREWIQNGILAVPRVTVPVDTSGFQIMRLEINLTVEGFLKRSQVVAALLDSFETLRNGDSFIVPREVMAQYATVAKLFGSILAPRPPDAIELSFDAHVYGLETVGSGKWYRFPNAEDFGGLGLNKLRREVSAALAKAVDPDNTVIITTAGDVAIEKSQQGLLSDPIPLLSSPKWAIEPISGARFYYDDFLQTKPRVDQLVLSKLIDRAELLPPVFNVLVPSVLRPARDVRFLPITSRQSDDVIFVANNSEQSSISGDRWTFLALPPSQLRLPLPIVPPEPSCRCCFVLQLLSSRPARANVRQAARAELWKLAFETGTQDLAELGAPGGLAYDISFNRFGLRIIFLGISQTIPSYARRLTTRLVQHSSDLMRGPKMLPTSVTARAVSAVNMASGLSPGRKRRIRSNLRSSDAYDTASEGTSFLQSCTGAVSFAEGDLMHTESLALCKELKILLRDAVTTQDWKSEPSSSASPIVSDLLYKPLWKPRNASTCAVSGVPLLSDACGRIMR